MSEAWIEDFLDLHYRLPPSSSSFPPSASGSPVSPLLSQALQPISTSLLPSSTIYNPASMASVSPTLSSASLAPSLPMMEDGMDRVEARSTKHLLTSHLGSTKKVVRGGIGKKRSVGEDNQFSSRVYHLEPIPARQITPTFPSQMHDQPDYSIPQYPRTTQPYINSSPYHVYPEQLGSSSFEAGSSIGLQHPSLLSHQAYSPFLVQSTSYTSSYISSYTSSYSQSFPASHDDASHSPHQSQSTSFASSSNLSYSNSHPNHVTSSPMAPQNDSIHTSSSSHHAGISSSPVVPSTGSGRKASATKKPKTPKKESNTPTRSYKKKSAYWEARKLGLGPQSSGRKKRESEALLQLQSTSAMQSPSISNPPIRTPTNSPRTTFESLPFHDSTAGGELAKLREGWKTEHEGREENHPGWLKITRKGKGREIQVGRTGAQIVAPQKEGQGRSLDLWQTKTPEKAERRTPSSRRTPLTPKRPSPNSRSYTSASKSNKRLARTVFAPCLRTSSTGKASLSSARILASEYDSLVPFSSPRQPLHATNSGTRADPSSTSSQAPSAERSETRRRRLAPFSCTSGEPEADSDADFFASPITERTKASDLNSKRGLVAARVVGVGRMIFGKESVEALVEGGTVTLDEDAFEQGREESERLASMVGRIRPDWPDSEFPWRDGRQAQERIREVERVRRLGEVERYLESSDDEDEQEAQGGSATHAGSPPSTSSPHRSSPRLRSEKVYHTSRGGKSSGLLFPKLFSHRPTSSNAPSILSDSFDPADGRHVLLLKHQTLRCATANRLPPPPPQPSLLLDDASTDYSLSADEDDQSGIVYSSRQEDAYVGCFCRGGVSEAEGGNLVECTSCLTWHHATCIGLAEGASFGADWCCWKCRPEERRNGQVSGSAGKGGFEESDPRTPTIVHSTPVLVQSESFGPSSSFPMEEEGADSSVRGTAARRGDRTPPRSVSTLALAPSPLFSGGQSFTGAIPIQRGFSTYSPVAHASNSTQPRTPSSTSALKRYTAVPLSPSLRRSYSSSDDAIPTALTFGTPSRRAPATPHHASSSIPRTPTSTFASTSKARSSNMRTPGGGPHADEIGLTGYPQTIFDLSSTPSRHLSHSREYPFGGTPSSSISRTPTSSARSDRWIPSSAASYARTPSGLLSYPSSPPPASASRSQGPPSSIPSCPITSRPKPKPVEIGFTTPSQTQTFFAGLRSPSAPSLSQSDASLHAANNEDSDNEHAVPELAHSFLPSSADSHGPISPYLPSSSSSHHHHNLANTPTQSSSSTSSFTLDGTRSSSLTPIAAAPSERAATAKMTTTRRTRSSVAGGRLAMTTRSSIGGASAKGKGPRQRVCG